MGLELSPQTRNRTPAVNLPTGHQPWLRTSSSLKHQIWSKLSVHRLTPNRCPRFWLQMNGTWSTLSDAAACDFVSECAPKGRSRPSRSHSTVAQGFVLLPHGAGKSYPRASLPKLGQTPCHHPTSESAWQECSPFMMLSQKAHLRETYLSGSSFRTMPFSLALHGKARANVGTPCD